MARGTWGGGGDPSIFKINILFLLGTSKCQTGFKVRDKLVQDNTAQEVADEARTQLLEPFRGLLAQTDSVLGFDVRKLGSDEGGWAPAAVGVGINNIALGDELPNFMCCNIQLKSEIRRRYGQGRFFLPIIIEDQVTGNVLSVQGVQAMQTFVDVVVDHFMPDDVANDLALVNAHPLLPARGAPGTPGARPEIPASWYDVTSVRVNTIVTALRSRKAGVGS